MTDTRVADPTERPVVLTIAGSDSGGGAGIQADLKTIEATGGFGTSAITAVTAQNTTGVESSHVLPVGEIAAQIDAVRSDFDVRAVKTGMLATAEVVDRVADYAADLEVPVVVDPVMVAASGDRLLSEEAESAYETLIAEAALVTPNVDEVAVLTGLEPTDEAGAIDAGEAIRSMGADAALIKGGHIPGSAVLDALVTAAGSETFRHPRVDTDATHGSGCTLSAAIATRLARGDSLVEAVETSVSFMARAVRYHHAAGEGPGPVHHLVGIRNDAARTATTETVHDAVERLPGSETDGLLADPDNVAAATPYAETVEDVAALDDGFPASDGGGTESGAVRFGVADDIARVLLDARESDPSLRVALMCGLTTELDAALADAGWERPGRDAVDDGGFATDSGPIAVSGGDGSVVPEEDGSVIPDEDGSVILLAGALDPILDLVRAGTESHGSA